MKKQYYTWADVETAAEKIIIQLYNDNWRPDYIVGITRGGLPLATILSNKLGIPMETLKVSLRGTNPCTETNCWMSEDAFGYIPEEERPDDAPFESGPIYSDPNLRKNILIVDDINDTGATFMWIKDDWPSSCLPHDSTWNDIWGSNVRFAVMTENLSSEFQGVNYHWTEVNKAEDDVWLVYPWEV